MTQDCLGQASARFHEGASSLRPRCNVPAEVFAQVFAQVSTDVLFKC